MTGLAKRLIACKHFRWMPGMHDTWGRCAVCDAAGGVRWVNPYNPADQHEPDHWPALTDPGTLGCLLALVAEAYGVTLNDVHVVRTTGMVWSVWIFRADDSSYRVATHEPSRAEALVVALEAAP